MLTDAHCRNVTCPPEKTRVRLACSAGLYLEVTPGGSKRWFWKYRIDGREKRLALGNYPKVGAKAARDARDKARRGRDDTGADPVQRRQLDRLKNRVDPAASFESAAREFHATKANAWSPQYFCRWIERLEKDVFPWLGALPIAEITAPMLLLALRKIEARGAIETAHTLRQHAGQVFQYGVATGRCDRNPARDLHGALQPVVVEHMAAVLEPAAAGELMRAIHGYHGQPTTRAALIVSALTFQRPGNVRAMEWAEVDLDAAMWTIPAAKMKRTLRGKLNGKPHLVPLARQAVEALRQIHPLTGDGPLVFAGLANRSRPMSENTVNLALRRMGFESGEMCAHGFRSMARTILVEHADVSPDVIEAQLAHSKGGPLGAAYDRAAFVAQRRQMMQAWADFLDDQRAAAAAPLVRKAA